MPRPLQDNRCFSMPSSHVSNCDSDWPFPDVRFPCSASLPWSYLSQGSDPHHRLHCRSSLQTPGFSLMSLTCHYQSCSASSLCHVPVARVGTWTHHALTPCPLGPKHCFSSCFPRTHATSMSCPWDLNHFSKPHRPRIQSRSRSVYFGGSRSMLQYQGTLPVPDFRTLALPLLLSASLPNLPLRRTKSVRISSQGQKWRRGGCQET